MPLLDIAGLHVDFPSHQGVLHAVDDLSLQLEAGEVLGMLDRPLGCLFAPRCSRAQGQCATPAPVHSAPQLQVRCHLPGGALAEQIA